jgi:5'-nucleotidase
MRILITNDDSIFAKGLQTLVHQLLQQGHTLHIAAPDRERSATSHALTLHDPLRAISYQPLLDAGCASAHAVTGTPVDCVKLAFHSLLTEKPDVVISGINHGPNLGNDIAYSGTVSAALEASHHQVRSIAVSHTAGYEPDTDFTPAAQFVTHWLDAWMAQPIATSTVLNVNVPPVFAPEPAYTTLSNRLYHNFYDLRQDPRNKDYYWLDGRLVDGNDPPETDAYATKHGRVSITPIRMDWLDVACLKQLQTGSCAV